jgi:hypothetical protein
MHASSMRRLLAELSSNSAPAANHAAFELSSNANILAAEICITSIDVQCQSMTDLLCLCCRWAFSIWGIIFALQGAGAIYAALPMGYQSPAKRAAVNTIGAWLEPQLLSGRKQ